MSAVQVRYLSIISTTTSSSSEPIPSNGSNETIKVSDTTSLSSSVTENPGLGYSEKKGSEESDIMTLVEMGFEFTQASAALSKCHGNVGRAAEYLFSGEVGIL